MLYLLDNPKFILTMKRNLLIGMFMFSGVALFSQMTVNNNTNRINQTFENGVILGSWCDCSWRFAEVKCLSNSCAVAAYQRMLPGYLQQ